MTSGEIYETDLNGKEYIFDMKDNILYTLKGNNLISININTNDETISMEIDCPQEVVDITTNKF